MIDPAIKKSRDEFIRGLGADLRAQGFDEKRIAWLLGPEAVAANRQNSPRVDVERAVSLRADGMSWRELGRTFDVRPEVARRAVKLATDQAYRARLLKQQAGYAKTWRAKKNGEQ